MEIEIGLYDMKVAALCSFDKDIIHDKIRTNECNKFGISGGDFIQEEEKAVAGR